MDDQKANENKETTPDTGIIEEKSTLPNGEQKIKKYTKGKALGRGGFAKCYEVTCHENKRVLAAKIIAKSSLNRSRAKQKVNNRYKLSLSLKLRSTNLLLIIML